MRMRATPVRSSAVTVSSASPGSAPSVVTKAAASAPPPCAADSVKVSDDASSGAAPTNPPRSVVSNALTPSASPSADTRTAAGMDRVDGRWSSPSG